MIFFHLFNLHGKTPATDRLPRAKILLKIQTEYEMFKKYKMITTISKQGYEMPEGQIKFVTLSGS